MPRKKKVEETVVVEAPKKKLRKPKAEKPTPSPEILKPVAQYEIDWAKIAADVKAAAEMVNKPTKAKKTK